MFIDQSQSAPLQTSVVLEAGMRAIRAVPPAFPLDATVAVNPFLGQTGQDFTLACARLSRCAGVSLVQSRHHYQSAIAAGHIADEDLAAALEESAAENKPSSLAQLKDMAKRHRSRPDAVPTIADLAADLSGIDGHQSSQRQPAYGRPAILIVGRRSGRPHRTNRRLPLADLGEPRPYT